MKFRLKADQTSTLDVQVGPYSGRFAPGEIVEIDEAKQPSWAEHLAGREELEVVTDEGDGGQELGDGENQNQDNGDQHFNESGDQQTNESGEHETEDQTGEAELLGDGKPAKKSRLKA